MARKPKDKRKFVREEDTVLKSGKLYATAINSVAAATIVDALNRAEGFA